MDIKKIFFDKNFLVKDFLKSYCLLCVVLFFKTALPNSEINDFFIILVFFICLINLVKIFINLIFLFKRKSFHFLNFLFLSSFIISLVRTTALYFARISQSKPGLMWGVDIGFSLSHSNNVIKHGSLDNSITMSGFPEAYHIGPSYISAIISSYLKIGIDFLSLVILPIIFFSAFIFSTRMIIKTLLQSERYEIFLSSLICFLPGLFLSQPTLSSVLNWNSILKEFAYSLPYQFSTMHNSMMAGSAILCIFYFLIDSIEENFYFLFCCSLSLYAIKPQYFLSSFLFISLFLVLSINFRNNLFLANRYKKLKEFLNFRNIFFVVIIFSIWFFFYKNNFKPFVETSVSFSFFNDNFNLANNFNSFNLKTILKMLYEIIIGLPLISSSIFLILLILRFNKKYIMDFKELFFINYSIILYIMATVAYFLSQVFPLYYTVPNSAAITLGEKIGNFPNVYGEYLITDYQVSFPLFTLVSILGISCITSVLKKNHFKGFPNFVNLKNIFLPLFILLNSFHTFSLVTRNNYVDTYFSIDRDELDATSYYKLIKDIPIENSLLLSNTVEQGYYGRIFRNTYLTAFTTHEHFIANIKDYHWRNNAEEALRRLEIYYQIFPNNNNLIGLYNPDSIDLVIKSKISHLIIKKVPSYKKNITFKGLKLLRENNSWILYKVISPE